MELIQIMCQDLTMFVYVAIFIASFLNMLALSYWIYRKGYVIELTALMIFIIFPIGLRALFQIYARWLIINDFQAFQEFMYSFWWSFHQLPLLIALLVVLYRVTRIIFYSGSDCYEDISHTN